MLGQKQTDIQRLWSAKTWTPDNNFLPLSCLIDTSAHLHCFRSDLVHKLGLEIKFLAKPLSVTLAFDAYAQLSVNLDKISHFLVWLGWSIFFYKLTQIS